MNLTIIYASYTGTTRGIAEQVRDACGGELLGVKSQDLLSRAIGFMGRHAPGVKPDESRTVPEITDVSGSDLVVIGTPVWGGKPVPAVRNAIAGLTGCSGKPVILYATCGEKPGETLAILAGELAAKGMSVAGQFSFTKNDTGDPAKVGALIAAVREQGSRP